MNIAPTSQPAIAQAPQLPVFHMKIATVGFHNSEVPATTNVVATGNMQRVPAASLEDAIQGAREVAKNQNSSFAVFDAGAQSRPGVDRFAIAPVGQDDSLIIRSFDPATIAQQVSGFTGVTADASTMFGAPVSAIVGPGSVMDFDPTTHVGTLRT